MKLWQISAAIRGLHYRDRAAWESTRFLMFGISCMFSGEGKGPHSVRDIATFPWEVPAEEQEPEPVDEEALQRLLAECREYNKNLKQ